MEYPSYLSRSMSILDYNARRSKPDGDLTRKLSLPLKCFLIFLILLSLALMAVTVGLGITVASLYKSLNITTTRSPTETSTPIVPVPASLACGIQEIPPQIPFQRIYGGREAMPNSWPWIVFYMENIPCNDSNCPTTICGGTLIDPRFVLTAAHCITSTNDSSIRIVAGLHNISSTTERNVRQTRRVERIFIYPGFDRLSPLNDIAILQLAAPFYLNKYVQLACLSATQPTVNETVIIAGWGSAEYRGRSSPTLKQASTQVVGDCNRWWATEGVDERRQICVANSTTGVSACNGDSGGPLLFKENDRWFVSGVASYVEKFNCKTNNSRPNVYTRVSYYLPWIHQIIHSQSNDLSIHSFDT